MESSKFLTSVEKYITPIAYPNGYNNIRDKETCLAQVNSEHKQIVEALLPFAETEENLVKSLKQDARIYLLQKTVKLMTFRDVAVIAAYIIPLFEKQNTIEPVSISRKILKTTTKVTIWRASYFLLPAKSKQAETMGGLNKIARFALHVFKNEEKWFAEIVFHLCNRQKNHIFYNSKEKEEQLYFLFKNYLPEKLLDVARPAAYSVDEKRFCYYKRYYSLEAAIAVNNRFRQDAVRIKNVALKLVQLVDYFHKQDYAFHDLKPGNILLSDEDDIRICDLDEIGTKIVSETPTVTIPYAAFELFTADVLENLNSKKLDVYSFGCTLFELALGRTPYVYNRWEESQLFEKAQELHITYAKKGLEYLQTMTESEMTEREALLCISFCCMHTDPACRPDTGTIIQYLSKTYSKVDTWPGTLFPGPIEL